MQAKNILQAYLRRLTNLTGNNRSLLLLRLSAEQLIDVQDFSFLNGERGFEIVRALMGGKDKKLCQVLDSRMEANNDVSTKVKKLQRIDRFIFEERGSNDLHVGWPFVRGKFSDGTLVRCPLLFFPVAIVQQGPYWVLQLREDAGVTMNKSFLLAYAFYNKVKPDEELLEYDLEDLDTDATVFRTQLYQLLKDRIEVNFNPDNFQDELIPFAAFKKDEFDAGHRNGELKLFPEAVLGIFPQAGSQLVPDYLRLMDENAEADIEDFFLQRNVPLATGEEPLKMTPAIKEEKLFTPFILDAYQENAIKVVKSGRSIVVQGPPGTGKSQLICNLLADAIASGKKALLVCQKRAALDVVYNRMKAAELGDFLGLIHDFRNDRREIYAKIANQIDRLDQYKAKNRSIDVIQTERKFFQICRRIDQITEELEEFKSALYNDAECGLSVKELYLTSNLQAPSINIKQEYQYFTFGDLHEFSRILKRYTNYAALFEVNHHPWRERRSFAGYQPSAEKEIEKTISDIVTYQKEVATEVFRLIGTTLNLQECESFLRREEEVLGMMSILKDDDIYRFFQIMIVESDDETSLLWLSNMERVIMNCFAEEGPEITIPTDKLGKHQEALFERMQASGNWFRLLRWKLFSKNKYIIRRVLVANGLAHNKYGLQALEQRIDNRLNLEHHLTALKGKSWLMPLPPHYHAAQYRQWFKKQKLAIRAKLVFNSLREVRESVNVQKLEKDQFIALCRSLLNVMQPIPEKKIAWQKYLSLYQINQIIVEPSLEKELVTSLRKDFDNLCEFDKLREEIKPHEREVILKLYDQTQQWNEEAMEALFQNSLRLAWVDHIETKFPVLRTVSSMKMDELQTELQRYVKEKHQLSQEILLVRAREQTYEGITYNRLNNRITYRDLQHQVTKKKKIWPVRKIISDFHEELFKLMPCWMASPESVSAIFPMAQLFDLVIFDEASQCFAERGVPAMYRGKQIVVAGDDQQLRPSELYQVRWDEETENPDLEVESLLELGERYLSTVHLQGHYRSLSPELIEFSNRHFYEDRLRLLPDREVMNQQQAAIEYCKVEGVWENQTNLEEAKMVAVQVMQILEQSPRREIGVVTFNAPQQMLVLDMLEASAAKSGITLPSSLFVKNIENVQGDEKDIIIFSIGYAPDKKGKMMMQFGSLNTSGGANRLNVAVTRAREKIILITSIFPEQLRTEDIKSEGPKLLRKYLEFARQVHERKFKPQHNLASAQNGSWHLSTHLQQWGKQRLHDFAFEKNSLPYADINVRAGDRYLGIILTDDERYLKALSVKEAHAYTPALLTQKNWNYHTVYSRNFWKDIEKVEGELMLFVGSHQV